jgi:hypothetical protein
MSFFRNTIRRQTLPAPAGLSRLLLQCRFDLQHKAWSLSSPDIRRDPALGFPADFAALATAISRVLANFSDPALGGANPSKRTRRRIVIRRSVRWSLGKTKTTKRKEI